MKKVNVGIDFGTSCSVVSAFDRSSGKAVVLKNEYGNNSTPSAVCIENGSILIGEDARRELTLENPNVIAFYKGMLGEVDYTVYLDGYEYTPEDLSAIFLGELKKKIERANGVEISGAVVTIPAYFGANKKMAMMKACKKADINVIRFIAEPVAAIMARGLAEMEEKHVLIYDLDEVTFDEFDELSLLDDDSNGPFICEEVSLSPLP